MRIRRWMPTIRPRARLHSLVTLAVATGIGFTTGCGGLSPEEEEVLTRWLTCDECTDGQLTAVTDTLGESALPRLRDILLHFPPELLEGARVSVRAEWFDLEGASLDSTTFIEHHLERYQVTVQRRATIALAALGDTAALRAARDSADVGAIPYHPDVLELVDQIFASVSVAPNTQYEIVVRPDSIVLEQGDQGSLEARTTTSNGAPMGGPVTWSTDSPQIVSVTPQARGHALFTGDQPGTASIWATFRGDSARAFVRVVPSPAPSPLEGHTLSIVSGDAQIESNTDLLDPLVVELSASSGVPACCVQIDWRVSRGGTGQDRTITDQEGRASFEPTDSIGPGVVLVAARASEELVVIFHLRIRDP